MERDMGLPAEKANPTSSRPDIDPARQREVGAYIERMAGELRKMAGGAELDFLAYLLGMAEHEAGLVAQHGSFGGQ